MASITGMLSAAPALCVPNPKPTSPTPRSVSSGGCGGLVVECSSRPRKKATSHHMKTRPKKTQPWDVRRKGPTQYPPLPPLPPDWTLASSGDAPQPAEEVEPASAAT